MDKAALKSGEIDAKEQKSRHDPTPQTNTSSSLPRPAHPKVNKAYPEHLSSSTATRRLSPLGDLGTLISKSQLHRRISPQPPPSPEHHLKQHEGPDNEISADQSKSRRATVGPDFFSRLLPTNSYGESNSKSGILDLYSSSTTSTTIPAPMNNITPFPLSKPTEHKTRDTTPLHQPLPPAEPNSFIPPLTLIHFHCYQSHRSMKRSSNIHAPVPCMTCRVDDTEMRWKCTWCCLRICGACMQRLENVRGKDLGTLVQRLGRSRRRSQAY